MSERVSYRVDEGVAEIRLARPEKRNALDREMFRAIVAAAERVSANRSVRAIVLSGEGKGFCAGLDLALFASMGDGEVSGRADGLRLDAARAVRVWSELPAPVIAAVHGAALGGGLQLALGADIRIVAPDAQLGMLEIRWGIVPDMGGTQLLPALVGPDRAKDLIFTGRLVDGNEALSIGLATRVSTDPRADALALAREIASKNPEAIRLAKRLVDVAWTATLDEGLRVERDLTGGMAGSVNQREAVLANQEQRSPRYLD